jgi:hypothetical protein
MDTPDSLSSSGQVCATCLHWRPEKTREKLLGWGQCRRMPPTMPPIQDDKLVHVGLWPHTREGDWCGEWQAPAHAEQS